MIAITPMDLTAPSVLISTNAVDAAAYAAGTTYAADVVVSYLGRNWLSLQASNTGNTPDASPLWWLDDGPINSLAMFDNSAQTTTTATDDLTVVMAVGRSPGVGLMNMVGQSLTLTLRDGLAGAVIAAETRVLQGSDGSYYSFCFDELEQISDYVWTNLLGSINGHLTISITGTGTVSCGLCVAGKTMDLGEAEFGASTPIESRGRDYLDALGNPITIERGYSRALSVTLNHSTAQYNRMMAFYAANISDVCLFVLAPGMGDYTSAMALGKISRVTPVIAGPVHCTTSIEVSGTR